MRRRRGAAEKLLGEKWATRGKSVKKMKAKWERKVDEGLRGVGWPTEPKMPMGNGPQWPTNKQWGKGKEGNGLTGLSTQRGRGGRGRGIWHISNSGGGATGDFGWGDMELPLLVSS